MIRISYDATVAFVAVIKGLLVIAHTADEFTFRTVLVSKHEAAFCALIVDWLNGPAALAPHGCHFVTRERVVLETRLVVTHSTTIKLFTNWTLQIAPPNVVLATDRLSRFELDVYLLVQWLFVVPLWRVLVLLFLEN